MTSLIQTVKGEVRGKVQGVFFRVETKRKADSLGLVGWVRNSPNGSVEFALTGEPVTIEEMTDWLKRGPFLARVASLDAQPCDLIEFSEFRIVT